MTVGNKTFSAVSWANGDHISTAKMSQETANDEYLYFDAAPCQIFQMEEVYGNGHHSYPVVTHKNIADRPAVGINGNAILSGVWSSSFEYLNFDISNTTTYPLGLSTLNVGFRNGASGSLQNTVKFKFLKTRHTNYLSFYGYWTKNVSIADHCVMHRFHVILHPDTQVNLGW